MDTTTLLAKRIGDAARTARTKLGLSQADVAERVEISLEFYGRIERGRTMPSTPTLVAMGRALHVSLDILVGVGRGPTEPARTVPAEESRDLRLLQRRLRAASPKTLRLLTTLAAALEAGAAAARGQRSTPRRAR